MMPLKKIVQHQAYRLVQTQLIGIFTIALVALLIFGKQTSLSILVGGLAYGLPNLFFVWRVFRYESAQQMNQFMVAFVAGEALKLIFCGILFVLVVYFYNDYYKMHDSRNLP